MPLAWGLPDQELLVIPFLSRTTGITRAFRSAFQIKRGIVQQIRTRHRTENASGNGCIAQLIPLAGGICCVAN